jgi:hypothetical protein
MLSFRKLLVATALCVGCGIYSTSAQIVVRARLERPHYERVVAPSPRHVWIDEEWEPRGGTYVFVGGRWAEPPHPHWRWVPGHWDERPRGYVWISGHWRR